METATKNIRLQLFETQAGEPAWNMALDEDT